MSCRLYVSFSVFFYYYYYYFYYYYLFYYYCSKRSPRETSSTSPVRHLAQVDSISLTRR